MNDFYLLYQPKIKESKIVGLEALLRPTEQGLSPIDFIRSRPDAVDLDLSVMQKCVDDIEKYNVVTDISINIHPESILSNDFIEQALRKLAGCNVMFELVEYQQANINELFLANIQQLRDHGIKISVDDFGKDFARTDVALAISADEVKFDRSLLKNIESNYINFKHLAFLYGKIHSLCTRKIVFEGVETRKQKELIEVFSKDPTIQGFFYHKPMPLSEIIKLPSFTNEASNLADYKINKDNFVHDLDYSLYNAIVNEQITLWEKTKANLLIKEKDPFSLVYNSDFNKTLNNLRSIYFKDSNVINNGVVALIDSTEKLVIIRNRKGVVIYDNMAHKALVGGSLVGIDPKEIIKNNKDYSICIEKDMLLISEPEVMFYIDEEMFGGETYQTIREKLIYNDEIFILTNICKSSKSLDSVSKDKLTGCYAREYLKNDFSYYQDSLLSYISLRDLKVIDDKLGHDISNDCLVQFSRIISSSLRGKDIFLRYDYDKFVIIFDSVSRDGINRKLEQLCDSVRLHFLKLGIELSFAFTLTFIAGNSIDKAIERAKKNMCYENGLMDIS
ncbi:MAG: EAL domain-containing protein [Enterovibrio sp.]